MTTATAACERKLKTVSRRLASAQDENAALKEKLAEARKRIRTCGSKDAGAGSADDAAQELARARKELDARNKDLAESLSQQTATSKILDLISKSPGDIESVLSGIAEQAALVCNAGDAGIDLVEGDLIRYCAHHGAMPSALPLGSIRPYTGDTVRGRAIIERQTIHVHDLASANNADLGTGQARGQQSGQRTTLSTPLLREAAALGVITIRRTEVLPFTDKQIQALQSFASQAVIAIENARLFNELEALNKDLAESLQHQAATSEVLRIVSQSFSDTKPVFDAIQQSLLDLFEGFDASVWLKQEGRVNAVAIGGPTYPSVEGFPSYPLHGSNPTSRCVREGKVIAVEDVFSDSTIDEDVRELMRTRARRALLNAPLISHGESLGMISVATTVPTRFTEKQIKLLQTFADQAVIAIQNVNLFNELQEIIRHQNATSNVLKIVGSSVSDAQPVFDGILDSVLALFKGFDARVWMVEGDQLLNVASGGETRPAVGRQSVPIAEDPHFVALVTEGRPYRVDDTAADPVIDDARREWLLHRSRRAYAGVPLLRQGKAIGAITISNTQAKKFSDSQMALLQTFADQAVIAIENARLFNELEARNKDLAETLNQQAATADVLRIVSRSVSEAKPVFDAIHASLLRLLPGFNAALWMLEGDRIVPVSSGGPTATPTVRPQQALPLSRDTSPGIVILDGKPVRHEDIAAAKDLSEPVRANLLARGLRTDAAVPLMQQGKAIGAITVSKTTLATFPDKHMALLQTFADQAVIAIENARLFNELEARNKDLAETLEQQKATGDILEVLSRSPTDSQPMLDTIVEHAARLCQAEDVRVVLCEGGELWVAAVHGKLAPGEQARGRIKTRRPIGLRGCIDTALLECRTVSVVDTTDPQTLAQFPDSVPVWKIGGTRSQVIAPLMRERAAIGAITVGRRNDPPLSDAQVRLLESFADQAVIGIENVRLFNELQSSLEHQTATGELLRAISRTSFDLSSLLRGLTETAARLCDANRCNIFRPDAEGNYRPFVQYGYDEVPEVLELLQREPLRINRESAAGRAVLEKRPIHIPDIAADTEFRRNEIMKILKFATLLAVPMLRNGEPIGVITMARGPVARPFNEAHLKLVATFADQAVIAIENVRLIEEIQEKSAQLEIANRHKSEFLANMSHELRTPLNAIIGFSEVLSDKMFGEVNDKQLQYLKTIHASGQHLLSLINDILDLAKIEAGRMELDLAAFSVPAALDNALTLIKERAGRHGVALEIQCDPALQKWTADERKFKQVMLNLLSNAVKFTPQGGKITVAAKRSGDGIEVSVTDTGVGIAPEDQQAVFEEFKQVGGDRLRKAEGTGLGLSLTKKFVELHGGQMGLASEPGKGSTFSFTLPETKRQA